MQEIIQTERLSLRPVSLSDTGPFFKLINDFDMVKMTASWPWPVTEEMVRERFERALSFDPDMRIMPAIEYDGQIIGTLGIGKKDDSDSHWLGYWIGRPWWGKGLMTEAVIAACRYSFDRMAVSRIVADHFYDNPGSGRVLEKAGFVKVGPSEAVFCNARQEVVPGWQYAVTRERLPS